VIASQPPSDLAVSLRALAGDDWAALRRIRLHALRTEPGLFFRRIDDEADLGDDAWIALASGDDAHQLFGLFEGAELVGISGVFTDRDDPTETTASLGMSYLLPAYRRRGFGSRLYQARLAWAAARPKFMRAAVGHRRSNEASRRAIARFGFRWTRNEPHVWPDGETEDDVCYELPLRNAAGSSA
jgi:RimJ/RimL family protein N-acetyltransferase